MHLFVDSVAAAYMQFKSHWNQYPNKGTTAAVVCPWTLCTVGINGMEQKYYEDVSTHKQTAHLVVAWL